MEQIISQKHVEEMSSTYCGVGWFSLNHHPHLNYAFKAKHLNAFVLFTLLRFLIVGRIP